MEDGILGFRQWGRVEFAVAAIVVLGTTLLLIWISQSARNRKGQGRRLPPGPKGWPLIGALPYLGKFPHRSFLDMSKKYGPIMYMHLGSIPTLVVSNAEMAKEVLQTNDEIFASRPTLLVPTNLYYGNQDIGFAPYGPHWRQARKVVNSQVLTATKLAHSMGMMKDEILSTVQIMLELRQSDGKGDVNVNLTSMLAGTAMNIITQMMWKKRHCNIKGDDSNANEEFHELFKLTLSLLGANNVADFLPSSLRSFAMKVSGLHKRAADVRKNLGEFCQNIIREKEQLLSEGGSSDAPADEDDFVSVLLKLKSESGEHPGLPWEAMQSILMDMVVGGTDTSAVTLDWAFAELMKHPHVMKKLQDELSTVVGDDRLVSESDIPHLKYLDAVVKEALRKHSVGPVGVPHQSTTDCKVGGYDIPANTTVFVNIFAVHRDETVWEKPWEFNPDRFLHSELDYKGRNFEFIPFSSGRRICPGMNMASMFMRLTLAQLVHTIRWSLPKGQSPNDVDFTEASGVVLCRATPLFLNAKPRLAHHVIFPTTSIA